MKLAVCDDVKEDADITLEIIKEYFSNKATDISYLSPIDLSYKIDNGEFIYDIIILDIDYKNCNYNGIELGKKINEKYPLCNIIYLTGILDFASDVYETNHCYFVMKKNQGITLERALNKAVILYKKNTQKRNVSIVSKGKNVTIYTQEILFVTREGRRTKIVCKDNIIESYISLSEMLKKLPDKFARCHTGYIINMDFVKKIENNNLLLSYGYKAPIGRMYKEKFIEYYMSYLDGRI